MNKPRGYPHKQAFNLKKPQPSARRNSWWNKYK